MLFFSSFQVTISAISSVNLKAISRSIPISSLLHSEVKPNVTLTSQLLSGLSAGSGLGLEILPQNSIGILQTQVTLGSGINWQLPGIALDLSSLALNPVEGLMKIQGTTLQGTGIPRTTFIPSISMCEVTS